MATPAQVTLIGNTQAYLNVRAAVLQHFWLVETVALDMGEMPKTVGELVVVCASLPTLERQQWVEWARAEKPLVLIVRVDDFEPGPLAGADASVEDEHGPGALVSAIYELLTERGLESREWPGVIEGGWVQ
jgi:hypothetical protein